jgi:hypothetical protein
MDRDAPAIALNAFIYAPIPNFPALADGWATPSALS